MPIIDDRGRLLGKVNLIDAVVGAFVIILIPVAYSAFLLFRTPVPTIASVEPAQIMEHEQATLRVTGEDLRPFLRAKLGTTDANAFLLQDPMHAEVKLPPLPPGTYDLVLYDEAQELFRKPAALAVIAPPAPSAPGPAPAPQPPPQIDLQAIGEFVNLAADGIRTIRVGLKFRDPQGRTIAEVLRVQAPQTDTYRVNVGNGSVVLVPRPGVMRLPAIIRVRCGLTANMECRASDTTIAQNANLRLPVGTELRIATFSIDAVRAIDMPLDFTLPRARRERPSDEKP